MPDERKLVYPEYPAEIEKLVSQFNEACPDVFSLYYSEVSDGTSVALTAGLTFSVVHNLYLKLADGKKVGPYSCGSVIDQNQEKTTFWLYAQDGTLMEVVTNDWGPVAP